MAVPFRNTAFTFSISLKDIIDTSALKANPTIAVGDFKISKDNGALANLATLPVVSPAGSVLVKIELSDTEMDAENVFIVGIDQTNPKEWCDFALNIATA